MILSKETAAKLIEELKLQGKKVSRKWEGTLVFCTGNVYTGSIRHRVSTQKEAFCP